MDAQESQQLLAAAAYEADEVERAEQAVEAAQLKIEKNKRELDSAKDSLAAAKDALREVKERAREAQRAAKDETGELDTSNSVEAYAETAEIQSEDV